MRTPANLTSISAFLALAPLALTLATPAAAIDVQPVTPRINSLGNNRGIDLQALQSQQRRLDFQAQQQRQRQDDRDAVTRPQMDLRVPAVKGNCRTEVFGNRAVATNCN